MKRSEAYAMLNRFYDKATEEEQEALNIAQGDIEFVDIALNGERSMPTIDPSSLVKRGRWEEIRNAYGELEGWLCECGREVKCKERFCPSCGARMQED